MEKFSAEREVRALGWAMKMIRARDVPDDGGAFHRVEVAYYADLKARDDYKDMRALWLAFTRLAGTLACSAVISGETREQALLRTYNSLCESSIEHDPDNPWGWVDDLDDEGAENAEEQLRYLRGEDDEEGPAV